MKLLAAKKSNKKDVPSHRIDTLEARQIPLVAVNSGDNEKLPTQNNIWEKIGKLSVIMFAIWAIS